MKMLRSALLLVALLIALGGAVVTSQQAKAAGTTCGVYITVSPTSVTSGDWINGTVHWSGVGDTNGLGVIYVYWGGGYSWGSKYVQSKPTYNDALTLSYTYPAVSSVKHYNVNASLTFAGQVFYSGNSVPVTVYPIQNCNPIC
jgi:hypothetical protein